MAVSAALVDALLSGHHRADDAARVLDAARAAGTR